MIEVQDEAGHLFTDQELRLLAALLGLPYFPGIVSEQDEEADTNPERLRRQTIAQLCARGVLTIDADDGSARVAGAGGDLVTAALASPLSVSMLIFRDGAVARTTWFFDGNRAVRMRPDRLTTQRFDLVEAVDVAADLFGFCGIRSDEPFTDRPSVSIDLDEIWMAAQLVGSSQTTPQGRTAPDVLSDGHHVSVVGHLTSIEAAVDGARAGELLWFRDSAGRLWASQVVAGPADAAGGDRQVSATFSCLSSRDLAHRLVAAMSCESAAGTH